jgi:DnaJ-class molecular chaperone
MSKTVEIVDKSERKPCRVCNGHHSQTCRECDGKGTYVEQNYFLVVEQTNGQKIAFQSEFIGK